MDDVDSSIEGRRLGQPLSAPEGFVALYRREAEGVLLFCARRVLDAEAAVDLTAETFAQAFRGRGRFRGATEEEAKAWLLTIARRQIARYLKRGSRDRSLLDRLGVEVPTLDSDELEEVERRAGLPALRAALALELARLSADQRQAVQLRVVEERSYGEIARRLGVSEATVRARVSRGLRALGAALATSQVTGGDEVWQSR